MKSIKFYLLGISTILFASCGGPEACIEDNYPKTVNVGDTVRFERCSENNLVNSWKVDDDFLNKLSTTGEDHIVIDGGGLCDDYVEIKFLESGTYSVDFTTGKKQSGNCSSVDYSWPKDASANITVN